MFMISKNKGRVIVSISLESINLLDKIRKWYLSDYRKDIPTRSEVIDDIIKIYGDIIGLK